MKWWKRYPGDYRRDTTDLTLAEHGAYALLMDSAYSTEAPLDPARVYRIAGAVTADEQAAVDTVLARFWVLSDDGWRNARVEKEVAASRKQADAGRRGAVAKSRVFAKTLAPTLAKNRRVEAGMRARGPDTRYQKEDPLPEGSTSPNLDHPPESSLGSADAQPDTDDFEAFKAAYPKRAGAQRWQQAMRAANARQREGSTLADMVAGAERYCRWCELTGKVGTEYVMQAASFLGRERHYLAPWHPPPPKQEGAIAQFQRLREEGQL